MQNQEAIKRKIRAIMAKAQDGSGATAEEAAAAMRFAARLMQEHRLSEADLAKDNRPPEIIAADAKYAETRVRVPREALAQWETTLQGAICKLFGTVGCYTPGVFVEYDADGCAKRGRTGKIKASRKLAFYGPEADAEAAADLFTEWQLTIAELGKRKWGGCYVNEGRSYCEGFARALYEAAIEQRPRALASGNELVVRSNALVVAKRGEADRWLREQGVRLSRGRRNSGGRFHAEAYGQGKADGQAAGFSKRAATKKLTG